MFSTVLKKLWHPAAGYSSNKIALDFNDKSPIKHTIARVEATHEHELASSASCRYFLNYTDEEESQSVQQTQWPPHFRSSQRQKATGGASGVAEEGSVSGDAENGFSGIAKEGGSGVAGSGSGNAGNIPESSPYGKIIILVALVIFLHHY